MLCRGGPGVIGPGVLGNGSGSASQTTAMKLTVPASVFSPRIIRHLGLIRPNRRSRQLVLLGTPGCR